MLARFSAAEERADYRAAIIASSVLNTIPRTKENRHKVFHPWDIFPGYDWQPKPQSLDIDRMILLNAAMGGTLVEVK